MSESIEVNMKHTDALGIAEYLLRELQMACEFVPPLYIERLCRIGGGLRRGKADVHDIEIIAKPIITVPRPEFGMPLFKTQFDKTLYVFEYSGLLRRIKGGDKMKQYAINLERFHLPRMMNAFTVEFYLVTPPAQWGVDFMIRTGPLEFNRWIVTSQNSGGRLPEGYRVKDAAVWRADQIDLKGHPFPGEKPLEMPAEEDFFDFLGLGWIEPSERVARWRR
jgi:DNA polymerase/3'-5' exonuclease PolX